MRDSYSAKNDVTTVDELENRNKIVKQVAVVAVPIVVAAIIAAVVNKLMK